MKATGRSAATVIKSLAKLESTRIVSELTNRQRGGRVFSYTRYIEILNEEMECPPTAR